MSTIELLWNFRAKKIRENRKKKKQQNNTTQNNTKQSTLQHNINVNTRFST